MYGDQSFVSTKARLALLLRRRIGSQREDQDYDTIIRQKTIQIFFFSMVGVVMMLIGSYTSYQLYSSQHNTEAYYDDPQVPVRVLDLLFVTQAFISSSTFVTIVLISQKYQLELIRRRAEWSGTNIFDVEGFRGVAVRDTNQRDYFVASYNFWGSTLAVQYALEVLVHLIHPIVWMASVNSVPTTAANYEYTSVNLGFKLFQLAMFLRLYVVFQLIHVMHPAYKNRFEVVNSDADLLSVSFEVDQALTLKMAVHNSPTLSFILVSVLVLLVSGFAVFNFERVEGMIDPGANLQYIKPENAFWFAFVTSRTIGFGEFSPRTLLGRVSAGLCAIAGIATASIYSGVLVANIPLSKELKQAVEFLNTSKADSDLRVAAAELIQTAWKISIVRRARDRLHLGPGGGYSGGATTGIIAEGDVLMDTATAKEQQAAAASMSKFGLDFSNQGHKGDRLYYAIKQFRFARKIVQGAFTQANDVVVNQKMDCLMSLSRAVRRELEAHISDFDAVEKEVVDQFGSVVTQMLYYKKMGHVPA